MGLKMRECRKAGSTVGLKSFKKLWSIRARVPFYVVRPDYSVIGGDGSNCQIVSHTSKAPWENHHFNVFRQAWLLFFLIPEFLLGMVFQTLKRSSDT